MGNPACGTSLNGTGPTCPFSDYKKLCLKWQHAILAVLRAALWSKEYTQTRNALLFLSYNSKVRGHAAVCSKPLLLLRRRC